MEGGEGSGKSTQAAILAERLGGLLTREPGGTVTGEHIRALILDPDLPAVDVRTETLLLLAARAQHVATVIRPALDAGRAVVCDRFAGSTLAYQGYGRGLPVGELAAMSAWASDGLEPDLVVLLQVPPEVASRRLAARAGGADRLEREGADFFGRVAAGFEALAGADPARWCVVDGVGAVDEVAAAVMAAVTTR